MNFLMYPAILWWSGVLHIPLVATSAYALILSYTKTLKINKSFRKGNGLIELVLCMAMCLINGNVCGSEVEPSRSGGRIVYVF